MASTRTSIMVNGQIVGNTTEYRAPGQHHVSSVINLSGGTFIGRAINISNGAVSASASHGHEPVRGAADNTAINGINFSYLERISSEQTVPPSIPRAHTGSVNPNAVINLSPLLESLRSEQKAQPVSHALQTFPVNTKATINLSSLLEKSKSKQDTQLKISAPQTPVVNTENQAALKAQLNSFTSLFAPKASYTVTEGVLKALSTEEIPRLKR